MKKQKIELNKKIFLKKDKIVSLNAREQGNVIGGGPGDTDYTLATCESRLCGPQTIGFGCPDPTTGTLIGCTVVGCPPPEFSVEQTPSVCVFC